MKDRNEQRKIQKNEERKNIEKHTGWKDRNEHREKARNEYRKEDRIEQRRKYGKDKQQKWTERKANITGNKAKINTGKNRNELRNKT